MNINKVKPAALFFALSVFVLSLFLGLSELLIEYGANGVRALIAYIAVIGVACVSLITITTLWHVILGDDRS